jgi:cell division protein FtsB
MESGNFFPHSLIPGKVSLMKIGRYLIAFVIIMGIVIAFGDRGLVDNYMMQKRLTFHMKANEEIIRENDRLKRVILLLRNDLPYIEMVARNELGMVKEGDLVYRFAP